MKGLIRHRLGRSLHEHFQEMPDPLIGHGTMPQDAYNRQTSGLQPEHRQAPQAADATLEYHDRTEHMGGLDYEN